MSIEKETKTKVFANIYHKTVVNLMFTNSWVSSLHIQFFKQFDLSQQQYNVLRILRGQYPKAIKAVDISGRMIDRNSNATRIIDKLEDKKLVLRITNPFNRREVNVSITKKGLNLLKDIEEPIDLFLINLFKNLNENELNQLNTIFDKLRY